jgi:hypothetical protein
MRSLRTAAPGLFLGLAAAVTVPVAAPGQPGIPRPIVSLEVKAPAAAVRQGQPVPLTVTLINKGKNQVTLVEPGDGSAEGWRTPVVQWKVFRVDAPPAKLAEDTARCGNVNALRPEEVFTLKPGESRKLAGWIGTPQLPGPGKYRVMFIYHNRPEMQWDGIPLGRHDPDAMARVRRSTPVLLQSNVVEVTVK